jgi:branched-chain amino acid transport system substrate-binding protein
VSPGSPRPLRNRLTGRDTASWAAIVLVLTLGGALWFEASALARSPLKIGVALALTGPDARWGEPILQGVQLAIADVNHRGLAGGYVLEAVPRDSAALGQDTVLRQRATVASYERFVADPAVIAAIGPQISAEGRAVAALLSRANLATITPSSTTFDITDPTLVAHFRPGGRTVFFRTIGTDLAQADVMARFAQTRLSVRRVVVIEDGLDSQARLADTFERRATALGITVLARRLISWTQPDYRAELRELAALKPDALYVAVRFGVGAKLARQIPDVLPSVHLMGTEQLYNAALPIQARATGAEGWYVPHVLPNPAASPATMAWADRFRSRYGAAPTGYTITGYTAVTVIADAVDRVVKHGRPVTRASIRDAIQTARLPDALAGPVSFDRNGDLERPAVSVYQVRSGAFQHVETILAAAAGSMARAAQ